MSEVISKSVLIVLLLAQMASCATRPAGSKAPVVEAGMSAPRTAPTESPAPAPKSPASSRESAPEAGYPAGEPRELETLEPVTEPKPTGSAVLALLQTADLQRADGQLAAAAASLERALRIEPQNPWTWYRLATVRLEQGRLDQAEQLARRCDSLAGTETEVRVRAWRLIATIRDRRGDSEGAQAAREQADALTP